MPEQKPALGSLGQEEENAEDLLRIACIPECWLALRHPALQEIVREASPRSAAELTEKSREVLSSIAGESDQADLVSGLMDILQEADHLTELAAESKDALVEVLEADPMGKRSALALALPRLGDCHDVIDDLLASRNHEVRQTVLLALIANRPVEEVLAEVEAAFNHDPAQLAADFSELGGAEMASMILDNSTPKAPNDVAMEAKARKLALEGDHEAAATMLETAWEASTTRTAELADRMGELAAERGETLVALQARERALRIHPTPRREAELAKAAIDFGDPTRALETVGGSPSCGEGWIARGQALMALDRPADARLALNHAWESRATVSAFWSRWHIQAWQALGESATALQLLELELRQRPLDHGLRQLHAEVAYVAGEFEVAAHEAALLRALSPETTAPMRLQAAALEGSGDAVGALPYRLELARQGPKEKTAAVSCALNAGEISTALTLAQELVQEQPNTALARVAIGKALVAAGSSRGGLVHLRKATELDPAQAETWLARSQVEMELGEFDRAGETLSAAIDACPEHAAIYLAFANWLAESQQWTRAYEITQKARALDPNDVQAMALQGQVCKQLGRVEEAIKSLEAAHARKPGDWEVRTTLAELMETSGEVERAQTLLSGLPAEVPAEVHAMAGRIALKSQTKDTEAEAALSRLLQAKQKGYLEPSLEYWLAEAYRLLGETSQALQLYQTCLKSLAPDATTMREACVVGAAESALASGQVPLAISMLEQANESAGLSAKSLSVLSRAYAAAGLAEEALPPALQACEMDPSDDQVIDQAISAALAAGRPDAVMEIVHEWGTRHPDDADHQFRMCEVFSQLGNLTAARKSLAHALWTVRHQAPNLVRAADLMSGLGDPSGAARIMQRAHTLAPRDQAILAKLAKIATHSADHSLALYAWKKLLETDPESIEATIGLADSLWRQEQRAAAIGALQRAVNMAPERIDLHTKLARAQLENGETQHALEHYRIASASSPTNPGLQLEAARAFLDAGAPDEAAEVMQRISEESTSSAHQCLRGEVEIARSNFQSARAHLLKIPDGQRDATAEALLAWALHATGEAEAADQHLSRALFEMDRSAESTLWVARVALIRGHWSEAKKCLNTLREFGHEGALFAYIVRTRLADAQRLFSKLCRAPRLGPAESLAKESALAECLRALDSLVNSTTGGERAALRARAIAAFTAGEDEGDYDLSALPRNRLLRDHAAESKAIDLLLQGDPDASLQVLALAAEEAKSNEWSSLLAGIAHLQAERWSPARKAFGVAAQDALQKPIATFLTGLSFSMEGKLTEAINAVNAAVLARPGESEWQIELAKLYARQGKPEAALSHLQQASETEPENLEIKTDLARALQAAGQISEAATMYEDVVASQTADPSIDVEAAQAFLAVGDPRRALEILDRVLEESPEHGQALAAASRAAMMVGDMRKAESCAKLARQISPEDPDVLLVAASVFQASGRNQQALAILDEARQLTAPPALPVELERARVLLSLGNPKEAISLLEELLGSYPGEGETWALLADAYAICSRLDDSIDAIRKALEIQPGSPEHRLALARYFRQSGQLDQALAELTALEADDPTDARIPIEIGLVHKARRQQDKALHAFQRAATIRPEIPTSHYEAGIILKGLKAYRQAAECFERVVELDPSDVDALHQLAAVQALELVHGGMGSPAVAT